MVDGAVPANTQYFCKPGTPAIGFWFVSEVNVYVTTLPLVVNPAATLGSVGRFAVALLDGQAGFPPPLGGGFAADVAPAAPSPTANKAAIISARLTAIADTRRSRP
jgi:hypothetical protein